MSRRKKIAIAVLAALVVAGVVYLPGLYRRAAGLKQTPASEEEEHRALVQPPLSTPSDQPVEAHMYWESRSNPGIVTDTDMKLELSANPVERGKQLLIALIDRVPTPQQRTLPAGTSLEEFYMLPGGIAVADFSSELSTQMPSGIQSEQMAVNSIVDTLAANIPNLRLLKILIDGHEVKTLAGHVDLTGYFVLHPPDARSALAGQSGSGPSR